MVGISGIVTWDELLELDEPTERSPELLPPPEPLLELDAVDRGVACSPELVELDELEAVRRAAARAGTANANATANETRLRGDVAMMLSPERTSKSLRATLLPPESPVNG